MPNLAPAPLGPNIGRDFLNHVRLLLLESSMDLTLVFRFCHGHRNKHVYHALSGRRRLVKLAAPVPSIPRHATR